MWTSLIDSWASVYANHAALRTALAFIHMGGLMAGGGGAITADLATITAARARSATLATQLAILKRTHHIVVPGLIALVVSGVLLTAADLENFLASPVFWLKMGLFAILVGNGVLLVTGERRLAHASSGSWTRLHYVAVASLTLWFLVTLAGTALANLG